MLDPNEETRLLPLAFAGLVTALTVCITGNNEHVITLAFTPIVVFWAIGESACEGFLCPLSEVVCYDAMMLIGLLYPKCIYDEEGNGARPIRCRVATRLFPGRLFHRLDYCQTALMYIYSYDSNARVLEAEGKASGPRVGYD